MKNRFRIIFSTASVCALSFFVLLGVHAQTRVGTDVSADEVLSAFTKYKIVTNLSITVPTVVEVPLTDMLVARRDVVVTEQGTSSLLPTYLVQVSTKQEVPLVAQSSPADPGAAAFMLDKNYSTYTEFLVPASGDGIARIMLLSEQFITSSQLTLSLDSNVMMPNEVELAADTKSGYKTIIAKRALSSSIIRFPETTARQWNLTLYYSQPLRITELSLAQSNAPTIQTRAVRFLAQPNKTYAVYFDPDRPVTIRTGESPDLVSAADVLHVSEPATSPNQRYAVADQDGDTVPDVDDNCPDIANLKQEDENKNLIGDACDDYDHDRVINSKDNCPEAPNYRQDDTDEDTIGDVCDPTDNRFTEQHKWVPWVGIGGAALVLIVLFLVTAQSMKKKA